MTSGPDYRDVPRQVPGARNGLIVAGAALVALALGLGLGYAVLREPGKTGPAPTTADGRPADQLAFRPIPGPYAPPDPAQIAAARTEAVRLYAAEGLSGVARADMDCYRRLSAEPSYALMDRCLALDVYGAQLYAQAAGGHPGGGSYFEKGPVRRMAAMQALTAGRTDASARLIDTYRLISRAADGAGPTAAATVRAAPTQLTQAPPASSVVAQAPPRSQQPAPQVTAAAPPPRRQPPEVAPSPPSGQVVFQGPAFNCRFARSRTERMICAEPDLAAADRRLNRAFGRAMANAPNPRALRREQDRWLAARESMGTNFDAVLDHYEGRTAELSELGR